jgi:hypothetical protein
MRSRLIVSSVLLSCVTLAPGVARAQGAVTRNQIVATARSYVGWAYIWGGSSPSDGGFDCSGLVIYSYNVAGVGGVGRPLDPWAPAVYEELFEDPARLLPGDVVWHRVAPDDTPHVGLYSGAGTVIHAANTSRGVVEDAFDPGYFNYYGRVAAGYWPGGDNGYNAPPHGFLDAANCDIIGGWAQDPTEPLAAIGVHIYVDGPAGSGNVLAAVVANGRREDLCGAIGSCDHAFTIFTPLGVHDGAPHPIHAYGIDSTGGHNPELAGSPITIQCDAPALPLEPADGVLRWVTDQETFQRWGFTPYDVLVVGDDTLSEYDRGSTWPAEPVAATSPSSEGRIYMLDSDMRRYIPDMASFGAWHFEVGSIRDLGAELDLYFEASPIMSSPFLVRGAGPDVFVVDRPPPFKAVLVSVDAPEEMASGDTADVIVVYLNRGTATWTPTTTFLGTSVPRDRSSAFQSDTWIDDGVPCGVAAETAPGQEGTFRFSVVGPAPGDYMECFALFEEDVRWFGDEGQGGPPDDALCREIAVTPPGGGDGDSDADSDADVVEPDGAHSIDPLLSGGCSCAAGNPSQRVSGPVRALLHLAL